VHTLVGISDAVTAIFSERFGTALVKGTWFVRNSGRSTARIWSGTANRNIRLDRRLRRGKNRVQPVAG